MPIASFLASLGAHREDQIAMRKYLVAAAAFVALAFLLVGPARTQTRTVAQVTTQVESPLPATFDLRTLNAVTPIKKQLGGTCWTHGTMAAIESNLLVTGTWKARNTTTITITLWERISTLRASNW